MTTLLVIGIFVFILYECFNIPIHFKCKYMAEYCSRGPSLMLSGLLGICSLLLWLVLKIESEWSMVFIIAEVLLATANFYWTVTELKRTKPTKGDGWKFVICQIIFAVGAFGFFFMVQLLLLETKETARRKNNG